MIDLPSLLANEPCRFTDPFIHFRVAFCKSYPPWCISFDLTRYLSLKMQCESLAGFLGSRLGPRLAPLAWESEGGQLEKPALTHHVGTLLHGAFQQSA